MMRNKKLVYVIYAIEMIDLFAVSLFINVIANRVKQLGGSSFTIGTIGSVYGAVQILSSPLVGWLSDRKGRCFTLMACLGATAGAYILQGYSSNLFLLYVARLLAGAFKHTQSLGKAILADIAPDQKAQVLGNVNSFGSIGFILGPSIGGYVMNRYNDGFSILSCLASAIFIINLCCVRLFLWDNTKPRLKQTQSSPILEKPSYGETRTTEDKSTMVSLQNLWRRGEASSYLILLLVIKFFFSFATIAPRVNLNLIMDEKFGVSTLKMGYLYSMMGVLSALSGFFVGPIFKSLFFHSYNKTLITCGAIKTIALFMLFSATTYHSAASALLLQAIGDPFIRVAATSMSLETDDDYGIILGLGQTAVAISRMIAPIFAGTAQLMYGKDAPILAACFASLIGLLIVIFAKFHSRCPTKSVR